MAGIERPDFPKPPTIRRHFLYLIVAPWKTFAVPDLRSRGKLAALCLIACLAARLPYSLQKPCLMGADPFYLVLTAAAAALLVALLAGGAVHGLFMHLLLNRILKARKKRADAMAIPFLALAPQALLALAWPCLFVYFEDPRLAGSLIWAKLGADLLTARVVYHGARNFGFGRTASVLLTLAPAALLYTLLAAAVAGLMVALA